MKKAKKKQKKIDRLSYELGKKAGEELAIKLKPIHDLMRELNDKQVQKKTSRD